MLKNKFYMQYIHFTQWYFFNVIREMLMFNIVFKSYVIYWNWPSRIGGMLMFNARFMPR